MRDLERAQDGTEVKAWELETLTDRAHNLGGRRDAFETLRDTAAEAYRPNTGEVWHSHHGSHQPDRNADVRRHREPNTAQLGRRSLLLRRHALYSSSLGDIRSSSFGANSEKSTVLLLRSKVIRPRLCRRNKL